MALTDCNIVLVERNNNYAVDNTGNVFRLNKDGSVCRQLTKVITSAGYVQVSLGRAEVALVHTLVAKAFIPNPESKPCVNHIDCDKTNNHTYNLEWCEQRDNIQHMVNLNRQAKGARQHLAKLTEEAVLDIRKNCTPRSRTSGAKLFADKYKVSIGTIENVLKRKTWKHL